MSMLAEPRRKQKWNLDPRGKRWSEDANKFGQKMLEKMGWTSGKGLGINEQGITKHIMLDDKHDKAGIGYDRNSSDGWIEQQEKFNQFLRELPKYKNQERDYEKEWEKSEEDQCQQSLELKSKGSLARMHYKKFTRGKDISKYSSKDVIEIFGKKESTNKDQIEKKQDNCIHEAIGTKDNRGGVITINSGSMADYFKNKLPNHIKNLSSNTIDNRMAQSDSETEQRASFGLSLEAKSTLPSAYDVSKGFSKKIDYAFDNPYLELDNSTETVSKIDSSSKKRKKEENATTLHVNETDKLNVGKKLKTEIVNNTCKDGFTNLALNLDTKSNENCNGKEFEVSRAQFGLENCGFDLIDEENDKKRVTFNDHVEYSMDSIKKKKGKVTLDKYEVEDKRKKIKKKKKRKNSTTSMLNGFINEALDVEILCPEAKKLYEEIKDNKLNKLNELKRKSKKIKKTKICKISNLETIQESPEQEKEINDTKIVSKEITLDSDNAENETDTTKKKSKKKKKKEVNIEDVIVINITDENRDIDVEQPIKDKKIRTDKSKTEELIISEKYKKKKKKDKKKCETDLVENAIIAINRDQQDNEILEKSKKQNHLVKVKNKDMSIKDPNIKILSIVTTEKEEKSSERVPRKEKGSHKKDNSNDINVCEEKEISDKENADEMQYPNIGKLLKKDKKRKKSKKDDTSNIENTLNPSAQMVDTNIGGETAKLHINTFSETNEIDTVEVIIDSPWNEKARVSKKMLKTLFYKNLADFPGSNIREIKGYGVDDSQNINIS